MTERYETGYSTRTFRTAVLSVLMTAVVGTISCKRLLPGSNAKLECEVLADQLVRYRDTVINPLIRRTSSSPGDPSSSLAITIVASEAWLSAVHEFRSRLGTCNCNQEKLHELLEAADQQITSMKQNIESIYTRLRKNDLPKPPGPRWMNPGVFDDAGGPDEHRVRELAIPVM